ncbi:type II toxin-antitoxin system RelE/ParE family toxin [Tychonema sp. LEGE 07203]|uniref:type II toxin-antitoxin system RelE family toxin n=1 Tax=Tychonema sp. LEGE 07203 TaxID=1828671 RepID=UPI0018814905|nr:type II toxin-antitoxin system RelE/ParE family toxin [Tychonema sp. LEGE 07203]MBE9097460.1 type II toxin-antitoxin system RelE/ParE family toxin [Tychonema sp. LEGE 07203]
MPYEIEFTTESLQDLKRLRQTDRSKVIDAIETHLLHNPTQESKSRIKRLREMDKPQYRLRVDEIRIYYDVHEDFVEIIAIVPKSQAAQWLLREGKTTEPTEE